MRILTVSPGLSTGGAQRVAANYAVGYANRGHDSRVLTAGGGELEKAVVNAGAGIWYAETEPWWGGLSRLLSQIEEWKPEVVHFHAHRIPGEIVRSIVGACQERKLIVETNIWGKPSSCSPYVDISFQLSDWCCWAYQQRVTAGEEVPILCIVPNTVRMDRFYPSSLGDRKAWRQQHGFPEDAIVLGRVGQSYPGKSHPAVLSILKRLLETWEDVFFVAVAPSDDFREIALKFDEKTRNHTLILDRIDEADELRRVYSALDIFLHTTTQGETFGNVLAEAQACETAVVSLATPGRDNSQCETVQSGETGFVVAKWNELYPAVRTLVENDERRRQMGCLGRRRVEELYSNEQVIDRLLHLIRLGIAENRKESLQEALREAGLVSKEPYHERMAQHLQSCYGGLPLYWDLWSRFDKQMGSGFKLCRRLDGYRRKLAEQLIFRLPS